VSAGEHELVVVLPGLSACARTESMGRQPTIGPVRSLDRATGTLERLGQIERYAEVEFGGDRMLDLDAAARRPPATAPPPSEAGRTDA
jgi:hypothetical protein